MAIDTGITWIFKDEPNKSYNHILVYQINDKTGQRRMEYDDATEHGKSYAEAGNSIVAKLRSHWIRNGEIKRHKNSNITFYDSSYAPLKGFQKWFDGAKNDEEIKPLLKHQMVKEAFEELETIIKLHT